MIINHLWTDIDNPPEITQSTKDYVAHIEKIQDEQTICSCLC